MPWEIFSLPALIFFAFGFFREINRPKDNEDEH